MTPTDLKPEFPSTADATAAQAAARRFPTQADAPASLRVASPSTGEAIEIPAVAVPLIRALLEALAAGDAVELTSIRAELTTQQAADLLGVSRPFLVRELERGKIPHRKVGSHRRILAADLLAYRAATTKARHQALDELTALGQQIEGA